MTAQPRPSSTAMRRRASSSNRPGSELLFPARNRRVVALRRAGVELSRPPDFLLGILNHLFPLRDPANGACDREQHSEHRRGESHRLERTAGIEIDIRVELLLDEIVVMQRDLFEFHCDVEQRIVLYAELVQDLVTGLL